MKLQIISCLAYFLFFFTTAFTANSQVKLPPDFEKNLIKIQAIYTAPLEDSYRNIRITENIIQPYELAIKAKTEKLEIRYSIETFNAHKKTDQIPHLRCLSKATSVATNEENSIISFHTIDPQELKDIYNADWGAVIFFKPKTEFSNYSHCKMLALFAEEKGMIYSFFLFDKPTIELDYQANSFRFLD